MGLPCLDFEVLQFTSGGWELSEEHPKREAPTAASEPVWVVVKIMVGLVSSICIQHPLVSWEPQRTLVFTTTHHRGINVIKLPGRRLIIVGSPGGFGFSAGFRASTVNYNVIMPRPLP